MKFSGLGRVPKHRKFDYVPRYYDADKEELEKRLNRYNADTDDKTAMKDRITHGFRQGYLGDDNYRKSLAKKSNLRLLYIVVILVLITYLFLTSDKLSLMVEQFLD
jgi:hypothetical protein